MNTKFPNSQVQTIRTASRCLAWVIAGLFLSGVLAYPGAVMAQLYWDPSDIGGTGSGGSGNWDSASSYWWNGSADVTWSENIAYFEGTVGTVTLVANETANGLTFTTTGYTMAEGSGSPVLTLGGATPTITVPSAGTETINCILAGMAGLTASGSGTLVLGANNTYHGGTTINTGTRLKLVTGGTLGSGNVTDNGTLWTANSMLITNNLSGTGGFTNSSGATTILSGSNSFTGNVYIDTLNDSSCTLIISNTSALNGAPQVKLTGLNTSSLILANNNATPTTTSINIPASVSLLVQGGSGANNRMTLEGIGGTNYWNGAITYEGDGSANELSSLSAQNNTTPACPFIVNGNLTASLANDFAGQIDLTGNSGGLGVMNGTMTLNTNIEVIVGGGSTWTFNSSGNSSALFYVDGGTLVLGTNNAVAVNVPFEIGNNPSILNLAGYNQQVGGFTNNSTVSSTLIGDIITNGSAVLSTLTYSNAGPFLNNGPNKANIPSGPYNNFGGVLVGNLALTVAGGTLNLSGASTYTGTTTISSGVLALTSSGSLASPNILISTNGVFTCSGQTLSYGQTLTGIGGAGTISGALNLGSASLVLNTNGTPALTVSNGTLTLNGANTVTVNVTGPLSPGTYLLVSTSTGGTVAGTPSLVTINGDGSVTGYLSISNSELYLTFSNSTASSYTPKNLEWRGTVNPNWDTVTTNWYDTDLAALDFTNFNTLDNVTFDDNVGVSNNTVNIPGLVQAGIVAVTANDTNYTFKGAGAILGAGGLTMSGNSTLTIQTTNGYTGVTTFNGGIVSVSQLANGGNLSTLGAAINNPTNLVFNGGQLQYTGPTVSINRGATLGAAGGTVTVTTPGTTLATSGTITGTNGGGLTVSGSGAFVFSGASTYNGPTTISAGATLGLNGGTLGSGNVTDNGTLLFATSSTVSNNISGAGILTNAPGATLTLSGSNTFSGNVYNGAFGMAPSSLDVSSSNALDGASQVILDGGNISGLNLYAPAGAGQTISIPANVTLTMVTGNGTANRAALTGNVNPCTWNGPINLEGDGSANEVIQFDSVSGSPFTINGNITATAANNFAGQVGFVGPGTGTIGVMNGNFSMNTNATLFFNAATWIFTSSGNTCGGVYILGGTLQLGANNAMPANVPIAICQNANTGIFDLAGYNQQVEGLTNGATTGVSIITNSSPTLSTLTYSNSGSEFLISSVSGFGANGIESGYFEYYNGIIGGNLALTVAGGSLNLGGLNTYTGATTITNGGDLALSAGGSIANSPNIFIGTNATFNVSGLGSYSLGSSQTLTGVGATGTIVGNLILGAGSSLVLNNYTTNIPTLAVTNGTLTLNGNAVTVNVSTPLATEQSYLLISATNSGQVSVAPSTSVTVNGLTNAPGTYNAYLSVSGGQLYLLISQMPAILSQFPVTYTNVFALYNGASPTFSIAEVSGISPFAYQWFTNGIRDGVATNSSLQLTNVHSSFANDYCVVTNVYGAATSFVWSATVIADPTNSNGGLANYPSNVLTLNPSGYWRMNETDDGLSDGNPGALTHDYAGGNDALYTNVNLGQPGYNPVEDPSDTSGSFGSFAGGVGSANSIQGIDVSATNGANGEFTIEAWVKASQPESTDTGIAAKGYFGNEEFVLDTGAPNSAFRFELRTATGTDYTLNSTVANYVNGAWYYLVGVCDEVRANAAFYINGVLVTNVSIPARSGIFNASATPMTIGARATSLASGINNQFYGNINDVAVFNYALSSNQIAAQYQLAGPFAPTITSQLPVTYTNLFTLYSGANPLFSVTAVGTPPLTYQWFTNGVLDAATATNTLQMTNVQMGVFSNYCVVSNAAGPATSMVWTASVIAPPAPYPQTVLALNPIGYWRLNDINLDGADNNNGDNGYICNDYVGGNNGIYTNVELGQSGYNPTADPSDTCADFGLDNDGNQTDFGNEDVNSITGINFGSPSGASVAFTVEAWVNGYQPTYDGGIATLGWGGGGEQFDLDTGANDPAHDFRFFIRDASGTVHGVNSTNVPLFGTWYHLVGVVDEISNQDVAFYIDGQLVGTASLPSGSGILSSTYLMSIGARAATETTSLEDQFEGEINDVAIFNYALSPVQVENEYIAGGGTNAPYFNPLPSANSSAAANSTLVIPVTALGSPPLSYSWTNLTTGAGIASGTTNDAAGDVTLSYPNVPLSWNGDQLQLTVTNAWGTTSALITLTIANGVNTNPTNIVFGTTNNQLYLTWPADHTGWQLQAQTNNLSVGIGANWVNVTGSTVTNQVVVPINLTNGSVFYRLIYNP